MESSLRAFPFRKLTHDIYINVDIMTYVEFSDVCKFMSSVNKETRRFIEINSLSI